MVLSDEELKDLLVACTLLVVTVAYAPSRSFRLLDPWIAWCDLGPEMSQVRKQIKVRPSTPEPGRKSCTETRVLRDIFVVHDNPALLRRPFSSDGANAILSPVHGVSITLNPSEFVEMIFGD